MEKKIVIIASYPKSLIDFRLHLIKEFIKKGFSVTAIAPYDQKIIDALAQLDIKYKPISLARNGNNPFKDMSLLIRLFFILRKEKPTHIFSYTIKPVIYGSIAAKLAGVPNIYSMITGVGYAFSNSGFKSKIIGYIAKNLLKISLKCNKVIFFQNTDDRNLYLANNVLANINKTIIINGSGVDINFFYNTTPSLNSQISFIMVARILRDKGIYEYVEAAKLIRKKYPHIKFKLAGWIDTNPTAISQQELSSWIKSETVDYLGKLEDVREAIEHSSIFVLPSYAEGTPRSVLEAMSMAKPIITTNAPGCRETVINNKNGFLIPVKNVPALYQAIEYFILQPSEIDRMGKESRIIASAKYDVAKVNVDILSAMKI